LVEQRNHHNATLAGHFKKLGLGKKLVAQAKFIMGVIARQANTYHITRNRVRSLVTYAMA
jgi:hypothetical protein